MPHVPNWILCNCRESGDTGSIPVLCWILLLLRGHFVWHKARQCTDTRTFYTAALSIIFFFLGFRQWRSRADRVLTLSMNIRLPLFWSTWSPARSPHSATGAGLAHARDYSNCRASELNCKSAWPLLFLELSKILLDNGLLWGVFNPHPQDWGE